MGLGIAMGGQVAARPEENPRFDGERIRSYDEVVSATCPCPAGSYSLKIRSKGPDGVERVICLACGQEVRT